MRLPHVDDRVRLRDSVPETALTPGQVGVVCSTWSGCNEPVFEVEFICLEDSDVRRQLLTLGQIVIDDERDQPVDSRLMD
jgi:hypothetical protein